MPERICLCNATVFTGITLLDNAAVLIKNGKIKDVISKKRFDQAKLSSGYQRIDLNGAIAAPAFIDTHIHGLHGFDTTDADPDSILKMSEALVEYGVSGFCPTLYPGEKEHFFECIRAVVSAMGREKGAKVLGLHMEGPFISRDKHGVLNPEYIREVDIELMKEYIDVAEGHIAIMTVAPELKNMRELALFASRKGIVLSAGHSNANYEQMLEGIQAGILHSTHFFNAMRRLHHRDPGVVGTIMIHPDISCEIIADGYHVHPVYIKMLAKEKPADKIVLVTDSLRPTGQTSGTLIAKGEEVYIKEGLFARKSDDVIAGSALTMIQGVRNLTEMGIDLENALRMASTNPATVLGLEKMIGSLLPGRDADIAVFDKNFNILQTIIKGKIVTKA